MLVQRRTPNDPAYWCFLLLGAGTLFPWNVLITAADFWEARYPGKHTDRLLTVCYLPTNLIVIAAMVHWHGRIRTRLRITAGLLGFTLALVGVVWIDVLPPSDASLAAVLLLVALCGVCDGLAQGALFGEVALLPPRYTQALVAGTAASGVVVSLLRIITKATLPDTEAGLRRSATIYFCIGAAVCAACNVVYAQVLPRMPSMRQHRQAALEAALRDASSVVCAEDGGTAGWKLAAASLEQHGELSPPPLPPQQQRQQPDLELSFEDRSAVALQDSQQLYPGGSSPCRDSDVLSALQSPGQALLHDQRGFSSSTGGGLTGGSPRRRHQLGSLGGAVGGSDVACSASRPETWTVLPQIWQLAAALVLIYTVTLSIFPGVLAEDVHSAELGSWYPVALLTAFNIADFIGKTVPSMAALRLRSQRAILVTTLSRALFIPAFHFAAVGGAGPAVIGLLAVLLGLSNGYLTAVSMMLGPAAVPPAAAEVAGNLMVLCLIAGLCIGAAGSFVWLM